MSDIGHTTRATGGDEMSPERRAVTSEIFTLLFEMGDSLKDRVHAAAERRDLGMAHVALLHTLRTPCRMGELARELGYDASHITAVVDRLEERDLVVRSSDPSDRRVRLIARTEKGEAVSDEIEQEMVDADEVFLRLPVDDCRQIRDLLQKGIDRYHASVAAQVDTTTDAP
jgi:DNA-binding MarR family transcriptional regulator